ncbi:hypothetical protein, partial [Serratia plymuthica]
EDALRWVSGECARPSESFNARNTIPSGGCCSAFTAPACPRLVALVGPPPSSSDLRLSLFRVFTDRMTLPIPRGHIIILHAKALAAQPIITLLQFIHLKLIFQVEHHSFDAVLGDRVMFLRPATTLNRLYFNHE